MIACLSQEFFLVFTFFFINVNEEMIHVPDVAVVEGVSKRDEGNRRKGPPEGSRSDENVRFLKNLLILVVADFLRENPVVPSVNPQKMHELELHAFFVLF